MALTGCIYCGLVLEIKTDLGPGHLTGDTCPECGEPLRVIDLAEAKQLTEERFIARRWREIAAAKSTGGMRSTASSDEPRRRSVLQRTRLDSDPRQLRASLPALDDSLKGCGPGLRRRINLVFSELVAEWQDAFAGDAIITIVEVLPGAVRVRFSNAERALAPSDWEGLVSPAIVALTDGWGVDRRAKGSAWFEFRPGHGELE